MTQENTQQDREMQQSDLSSSILKKIEQEGVGQVPRWQFTLGEYSMWLLWALSVFIGAIAFSIIIFFGIHAHFAPYEATHDGVVPFFLEVMPYAWVLVFILMALIAHYNLRHTKRGYTFAVWQVLLSSLIVSLMGGVVLHTTGMSFKVDHLMANHLPFFPALQVLESRMWQHPEEGRMVGSFTHNTEVPHVVAFTDVKGAQWKLDIQELNARDLETLYTDKKVRIVGLVASSSDYFYGCGVFPWITERNVSLGELKEERTRFIERMREYHEEFIEAVVEGADVAIPQVRCATHQAVIKLRRD